MVLGLILLFLAALLVIWGILVGVLLYELTHPPRHTAGWALAHRRAVDPEQVGYSFSNPEFADSQGRQIPTWEIQGQPPASREPVTIVFIHGWGHSRLDMLPLLSTYINLADRLVLFDMPGHGEAAGTSALGQDELPEFLKYLEQLNGGSYVLVGGSMGSVIALAAAASQAPIAEHIVGVIAYAPYIDLHPALIGRLRIAAYPTRPVTDFTLWLMRLFKRVPLSLTDEPGSVKCPVLLVAGEKDIIAPPKVARELAQKIPRSQLCIVPDVEHCDVWEQQSQQIQEHVMQFFGEVTQRQSATTV